MDKAKADYIKSGIVALNKRMTELEPMVIDKINELKQELAIKDKALEFVCMKLPRSFCSQNRVDCGNIECFVCWKNYATNQAKEGT